MNPNLNQVLRGHQLQHTHFHSHNSEKIEYNMHDHHCRMFELHDEQLKTLCLVGSDLQNVQGNPAIIPIMLIFIRHESDFMQFQSDLLSNTINPLSEHIIFCPLDYDQLPILSGSIELIKSWHKMQKIC